MFARSMLRAATPIRQGFRSYATESKPSGGSYTPYIVGAAALGAGYYGYTMLGSNVPKVDAKAAGSSPTPAEDTRKAADPSPGAKKAFTGGDQGFIDLKLAKVTEYNHNTKSFRFELPEADQVSGLHVASAIITKFKSPDMEKPVIRPYTPTSDESEKGFLELLVKRYPNGPMSEHLHSMVPGQMLSFKGPIPKYPWSPNKHKHVTLICGGTGVTPMYQLTRAIFNNPEDTTKVSLVFGNLTEKDILLKEEFERLENEYPQRFRAFYTLDTPPESWPYGRGHITKELLKEVLPDPGAENIKVFVCGPPGLYKAVSGTKPSPQDQGELSGILKELGYTKEQVFKF